MSAGTYQALQDAVRQFAERAREVRDRQRVPVALAAVEAYLSNDGRTLIIAGSLGSEDFGVEVAFLADDFTPGLRELVEGTAETAANSTRERPPVRLISARRLEEAA